MTEENITTTEARTTREITLGDLQHDATMLVAMIEGISVLQDQSDGPAECPMAKRAREAISPTLDMVIEKGWELARAIDRMDMRQSKAVRS